MSCPTRERTHRAMRASMCSWSRSRRSDGRVETDANREAGESPWMGAPVRSPDSRVRPESSVARSEPEERERPGVRKNSNYLALCVRGADDGNRTAHREWRDLPEHENPQVVALLITPLPSVPPRCADPCAPSGCTTFAHTVHPRGCTMGQIEGHPVAASRRERRRKSPSACQIGKLRTPLRADLELHLPALILSVSRCPPGSLGWCTWCGTGLGLLVEMMTVLIVGVLYGVTQATQGNGHPGFRLKCPVALEAVAQDRCAPLAGDSRSEHVTSNFLSTGNHLSSWCVRMPCSATMGRTRSRAPVHSPSSGRRYGEIARDFALI